MSAIEVQTWPDRKEGKPSSQWAVSIIQSPGFAKDSPSQGVCSKASTETRLEDSHVLYESNRTSCVKHMRWLAGQFHHSSWQGGKDIWSYFTIEVFFLLFFTGNPYFINQTDNGKRLSKKKDKPKTWSRGIPSWRMSCSLPRLTTTTRSSLWIDSFRWSTCLRDESL